MNSHKWFLFVYDYGMKKEKYPLNALDKFILAHESEQVSYNSQIAIVFDGKLDSDFLYEVLLKAVKDIPLLRSKTTSSFFSFKRTILKELTLTKDELILEINRPITRSELDQFCANKFDLENGKTFKFLMSPTVEGKTQLIFNIHHSLCDAAGHFLLLEEIFRLLNLKEVRPEARKNTAFRYRDLRLHFGLKWMINKALENRKSLKNQRQYKMATLIENPTLQERQVTSLTYLLDSEESALIKKQYQALGLSLNEYVTLKTFKAIDLILKERNDHDTPIMAYIPKTLRPYLKLRYSFSNILSTVIVVGKRNELHTLKFQEKIKKLIQGHKIEEASKFIFSALMACSITLPHKLKKYFKDLDQDSKSITSSVLISAGKVPRSYEFPEFMQNIQIWARGTMLKSPGIGVIVTGTFERESLTLEYLKNLTSEEMAEKFLEILMLELAGAQDSNETNEDLNYTLNELPISGIKAEEKELPHDSGAVLNRN